MTPLNCRISTRRHPVVPCTLRPQEVSTNCVLCVTHQKLSAEVRVILIQPHCQRLLRLQLTVVRILAIDEDAHIFVLRAYLKCYGAVRQSVNHQPAGSSPMYAN